MPIRVTRRLDGTREFGTHEQENSGDEVQKIIVKAGNLGAFKQHELISLEICLQEALVDQPALKQLFSTLANETTFVKPPRKQQFLSRTKEDIQEEKKALLQIANLKSKLTTLDTKIEKFSILTKLISGSKPRLSDLEFLLDTERVRSREMKMNVRLRADNIKDSFDYLDDLLYPDELVALVSREMLKSSDYNKFIKDLVLSKSTADITVANAAIYLELQKLVRPLSVMVRKIASLYKFYSEILPKELEYRILLSQQDLKEDRRGL